MFQKVPSRPDFVAGEHEVLRFWQASHVFEKLRRKNAGKPRWSFLDGPITANNPMGVHHAWGRTYKDCYQRYFAMTGHDLRWQNGFDCQGLWVEVEVERELGIKSKRDIETLALAVSDSIKVDEDAKVKLSPTNAEDRPSGIQIQVHDSVKVSESIGLFVQQCKERVDRFARLQTEQSIRLGYWMDWDREEDWQKPPDQRRSYFTMSEENNYTIWAFLKKCHQRGLIYKGLDAMPWCPRCGTGISEQERREGYKRIEDESVYVAFPLVKGPRDQGFEGSGEDEYLLVWTTTPWTLTANVACAVHPDLRYVKVRQGERNYWIVRSRWEAVMRRANEVSATPALASQPGGECEIVEEAPGSALVGRRYRGPFDELPAQAVAKDHHRVIPWSEVSDADGTGIVHIAPGCGKEDFDLSKEHNLPVLAPIDEEGRYIEGYGKLTGRFAGEVAPLVYDSLKQKDDFYKSERYVHDYPHCWRCGTPLLFRAVDEWYINMSWRDEIKDVARQIRWIPDYGLDLELDWLTNMGDWMISKKRYWGLALPIWECGACGHFDVIGSKEELRGRAVEGWEQFEGHTPHRPWVDSIKIACSKCGQPARRIPDVGNPWLDAGIVPYSTAKYNSDRQYWKKWIPADLVLECFPGQFRNWFYSLLAMSTMMEKTPPFQTLVGHALVRDEHGEEMHKSKGNAIWFDEAAEQMGVDVMRWIFSRQNPTINLNFGYTIGKQTERQVFLTLWNTYAFFTNYAIADRVDPGAPDATGEHIPVAERPEIDRWILSRLHSLIRLAHKSFRDYNAMPVVREAETFIIEDLSNWYIRRNRRRFWRTRSEDDRDKWAAYQTLHEVLVTLCKLLAPVIPFLTERIYQNLVRSWNADAPESVHLCDYPQVDESLIDEDLNDRMSRAQELVRIGHAQREEAKRRTRQPLPGLRISVTDDVKVGESLKVVIQEELNVKSIVSDPGLSAGEAQLDTRLSPELIREGLARDVVRHIQQLRKEANLDIQDRIHARYHTENAELQTAIAEWSDYIKGETLAVQLNRINPDALQDQWHNKEVRVGNANLHLALSKA